MSPKKWRNAILILLLIAGLIFAVENIMNFFLSHSAVPDVGIQDVKSDLTSIFRIVTVFALVLAVILFPIWVYKVLRSRKGGGSAAFKPAEEKPKKEKKKGREDEYADFLSESKD